MRLSDIADRAALERLQSTKLRRLMAVLEPNLFYRAKLEAAGVERSSITRLADLSRLPFTTKAELVEAQRDHPPYGGLTSFPLSRYRYLHRTSGTRGKPLVWLDTEEGWATWMRCWAEVYRGAGVDEDDVVFCAFSFGPYVAHFSALAGAREIGALAVSGGGMGSRARLEAILDHGATVVLSTPTYALHLGEVAAEHGLDLAASAVRVTIHAGEPGASIPNVRRRIEEVWGARCFDHAGATEVGAWGFACREDRTAIHLNEAEFVFEVVDPETAEPAADGTRGELVITTLGRPGMPVVRYRTGDLVVRTHEPCPCGLPAARIEGGVLGRADDMVVVRGVNVFPGAVDDLVRGVPEVVEYQVTVRRSEGVSDLLLEVETAPGEPFAAVERALREAFRLRLDLRIDIARAAPGSLPRYELKARRFRHPDAPTP